MVDDNVICHKQSVQLYMNNMETDTDFVLVMYMHVTRSSLIKIMDHSNSALWTIPKLDFRNVYQNIGNKKKLYIFK